MILTFDDVDLIEQISIKNSRVNFLEFRKYVSLLPDFMYNWFVIDLCRHLQQFYIDFITGKRPKLIISTPPQHGKSAAITDFIAWMIGKCSETDTGVGKKLEIILAAFSDRLSTRHNKNLQKVLENKQYQLIFPKVHIPTGADRIHVRTSHLVEFPGIRTSFRNTTVDGSITGETCDFGIIDDPFKNRKKANNPDHRNDIWNWYHDDFDTRLSEYAGLIITNTRWHIDDLTGKLIKFNNKKIKVLNYKAIAEEDEPNRKQGEALFPKLKSIHVLSEKKESYLKKKNGLESWESLYQGNPVVSGGNLFKIKDFNWWVDLPQIKYKFIVADTAQKVSNTNDFTDFQCWGYGIDNNIYLLDHLHKRMTGPELSREAKLFYIKHNTKRIEYDDATLRKFWIEDASSGIWLIQELKEKQLNIGHIGRRGTKLVRAPEAIPYIECGRVFLNRNIKDIDVIETEATQFPSGKHDDAIDNLMNAVEVAFMIDCDSFSLDDLM